MVRILLADDHAVVAAWLRARSRSAPGLRSVRGSEQRSRGGGACRFITSRTLAVLDISLPIVNGIEGHAANRKEAPGPRS